MPDDRRQNAELNRFWNELVQSAADPAPGTPDPRQTETLRRIHEMTRTPPPAGARARVDRAMRTQFAFVQNGKGASDMTEPDALALGPLTPKPPMRFKPSARQWAAPLTTAAMVLIALALAFLTLVPPRPAAERTARLPIISAPATPEPTAAMETLFTATLPANERPADSPMDLLLEHFVIAPGVRAPVVPEAQTCCRGPQVTHVLAGEVTLTVDGPVRVYRKGAAETEQPAPGEATLLQIGDTAVYDYQRPTEFANLGSSEARVLSGGYWSGTLARPSLDDTQYVDFTEIYPAQPLPPGPFQVTLARVTLPPGASSAAAPPGALVVQVGATGDTSVGENSDGSLRNVRPDTATIFVLTLEPALATLRNPSPEPATTATSAPQSEVATVFSTMLPAAQVPTAGNLDFLFWRVSLDPGSRGPASTQSWTCCPGPQITHVLEGDLTLQVEGPARIFRGADIAAGGTKIPPDTEVALRPGDTAVYDHAFPAEFANRGAQPVELVGGGIFAGAVCGGPAGATLLDYNEAYSMPALPAGSVEATLVRATLPPGGEVPPPSAGALVLDVGAFGDADIAKGADGSVRNIGVNEETIYVLTLVPANATTAAREPPAA